MMAKGTMISISHPGINIRSLSALTQLERLDARQH